MTRDDRDVVELLRVERDFGDRIAAVVAWVVPSSERYPEGVKYSMQYGEKGMDGEEGDTIIRYDNFPEHSDEFRHHKHTLDGEVEPVDFPGVHPLYRRFTQEVRNHGEHWPDD